MSAAAPGGQSSGGKQQATSGKMEAPARGQQPARGRKQQQQMSGARPKREPSQQQDSSDGYVAASTSGTNQYEDFVEGPGWRTESEATGAGGYRHFDPYSIYSEEEDVWYSEERLFEVSPLFHPLPSYLSLRAPLWRLGERFEDSVCDFLPTSAGTNPILGQGCDANGLGPPVEVGCPSWRAFN